MNVCVQESVCVEDSTREGSQVRKRGRVCCTSTSSLSIPHALRSLAGTYSRYPGEWEGGDDDVASEVRAIATAVSAQGHHPGVVCTGYVLRHRGLFCPCKLCCQSKYLPLQLQQAGTQGATIIGTAHAPTPLHTLVLFAIFISSLLASVVATPLGVCTYSTHSLSTPWLSRALYPITAGILAHTNNL